jgi:Thioredoxin-like
MRRLISVVILSLTAFPVFAQKAAPFAGATQWTGALAASDLTSLMALYSTSPPARFIEKDAKAADDISPETDFWAQQIKAGMTNPKIVSKQEDDKNGLHLVNLQVQLSMPTAAGPKKRYVIEQQAWQQQGDQWRIVAATHTDLLKMLQPKEMNPNLYPKDADAHAEIEAAVAQAAKLHKRVILVFGGNWCYDCHVLDSAFHQTDVEPLVEKNFEVVHVDIGDDGKKNSDLVEQYKIPLDKGVPALAVLDSNGKLLYSQQNGEWQEARSMDPDDIIAFLKKWKP